MMILRIPQTPFWGMLSTTVPHHLMKQIYHVTISYKLMDKAIQVKNG